jgi:hypothetical protein
MVPVLLISFRRGSKVGVFSGVVVSLAMRFFSHFVSGVVFFGSYARRMEPDSLRLLLQRRLHTARACDKSHIDLPADTTRSPRSQNLMNRTILSPFLLRATWVFTLEIGGLFFTLVLSEHCRTDHMLHARNTIFIIKP